MIFSVNGFLIGYISTCCIYTIDNCWWLYKTIEDSECYWPICHDTRHILYYNSNTKRQRLNNASNYISLCDCDHDDDDKITYFRPLRWPVNHFIQTQKRLNQIFLKVHLKYNSQYKYIYISIYWRCVARLFWGSLWVCSCVKLDSFIYIYIYILLQLSYPSIVYISFNIKQIISSLLQVTPCHGVFYCSMASTQHLRKIGH